MKDGKIIGLNELVKVSRVEEQPQSYYRINGLNSIYLSVVAEETANQLALSKEVKAYMDDIRLLLPVGYEIHTRPTSCLRLQRSRSVYYRHLRSSCY